MEHELREEINMGLRFVRLVRGKGRVEGKERVLTLACKEAAK